VSVPKGKSRERRLPVQHCSVALALRILECGTL
jgi:hypothetical protein